MSQSSQISFHYVDNQELFCENISVAKIINELNKSAGPDDDQVGVNRGPTPLFVYSRKQLISNIQSYQDAVESAGMKGRITIFYAVKANANLRLMEVARDEGCGAVTVSGYEIRAALAAGFQPEKILLNGNGKQMWEIDLAVHHGCLLNVDSLFDAENIVESARRQGKTVRVLIRVNPGLDHYKTSPIHQYLATALKDSKFGVPLSQFQQVVELLKGEKLVRLIGLHSHLGSTIRDATLYADVAHVLVDMRAKLLEDGHPVEYLDIGGGLGIDYYRGTDPKATPLSTPAELIRSVASILPSDVRVIIEPGRSIMANTCLLVTRVLGTKRRSNDDAESDKQFVVVDAAMNDLIRPSFYQAYHHVLPVIKREPMAGVLLCDVVGPICESGDFLALNRPMSQRPVKGDLLAICDAGAYGMAMASNYNMRPRALEVLVDGTSWKVIRRRETFDQLIQTMME